MFDPQKVDPDLVLDISAKTGLHVNVVEQLLENGWSYKEANNGHEWTINALEPQRVHMIAPSMEIPVPMMLPLGTPITSGAIEDVWNLYVKPGQDAGEIQSVEERTLMAILRSMYAGFDPTGSGWKPEMKEFIDLEPIKNVEQSEDYKKYPDPKPVRVRYFGDEITEYESEAAYQEALEAGADVAVFGERLDD